MTQKQNKYKPFYRLNFSANFENLISPSTSVSGIGETLITDTVRCIMASIETEF